MELELTQLIPVERIIVKHHILVIRKELLLHLESIHMVQVIHLTLLLNQRIYICGSSRSE